MIEDIHHAASLIRAQSPELALRLYQGLLEVRPNGKVIQKAFNELKDELKLKSYVVVGNCQAKPTSKLLTDRSQDLISRGYIKAFNYTHTKETDHLLDEVDYIFTQKLADSFPKINTKALLNKYGSAKVILISNLYFSGDHPDWCYIPTLKGKRLTGPVGDYHNRTIIDAYIEGVSTTQARKRFESKTYNEQMYKGVAERSITELKHREVGLKVPMWPIIQESYERNRKLFYTFNHPTNELLELHVDRIINAMNLSPNHRPKLLPTRKEMLGGARLRTDITKSLTNPDTNTVRYGNELNSEVFVDVFYEIYRNNPDYVAAYKKRLSA